MFAARSDLALETGERVISREREIRGVRIEKKNHQGENIKTTVVHIESENASKIMGKPQGQYITIEAPELLEGDHEYQEAVSREMAERLKELFPMGPEHSVLVVGLGNQDITPDALGPWSVDRLKVTRHLVMMYGKECLGGEITKKVSALIPGVMATTGMETLEIIKGVSEETKPDLIIAIDALAARGIKRLGRTIQMTDAGINPGSGVGNHRQGLSGETLGIPVLGIGVPTVVDAATIVYDAMYHLMECLECEEREHFLEEMMTPNLRSMFVTPRDVDETVTILSDTVARGINLALQNV